MFWKLFLLEQDLLLCTLGLMLFVRTIIGFLIWLMFCFWWWEICVLLFCYGTSMIFWCVRGEDILFWNFSVWFDIVVFDFSTYNISLDFILFLRWLSRRNWRWYGFFCLKNTGENLAMELLVGYGCRSLEIFGIDIISLF